MSMTHWLVVAIVVLLLFGRGKISELMGDVAKGIKSFKKGMSEEETAAPAPASDPFKRDEPRALDSAAVRPAGQPSQTASTPQANKAS